MQATPDRAIEGRAFPFVRLNERPVKPRTTGMTEIRGPYYTTLGRRALEDILETMGEWIDALKFAGGSFTLMPRHTLLAMIELCHRSNVLVSTGGFIEHMLTQGPGAVDRYINECREYGFDIVEISSGFISMAAPHRAHSAGRPESQSGGGHSIRRWRQHPSGRPRTPWDA
jgi:phosphosulfolactate synthase (CoM biosynthesis protein A)